MLIGYDANDHAKLLVVRFNARGAVAGGLRFYADTTSVSGGVVQVPNMSCNASSSTASALSSQRILTVVQAVAYRHQIPISGGRHLAGSRSPLDRLDEPVTAISASRGAGLACHVARSPHRLTVVRERSPAGRLQVP